MTLLWLIHGTCRYYVSDEKENDHHVRRDKMLQASAGWSRQAGIKVAAEEVWLGGPTKLDAATYKWIESSCPTCRVENNWAHWCKGDDK